MEMAPTFVEFKQNNFKPSERWRIMKNILMIGFAFMLQFTAFMGASNLQSSVNADDSLGTFTLSAIYGSLIFSNIFLPMLVIRWVFQCVPFFLLKVFHVNFIKISHFFEGQIPLELILNIITQLYFPLSFTPTKSSKYSVKNCQSSCQMNERTVSPILLH